MTQGYEVEVQVFDDAAALAAAAADLVVTLSASAIAMRGRFTIALSGGSTPRGLYSLLASPSYRDRVDWKLTHVFWTDERCVPPDHPDSNYRLASDLLLSQVPVPEKNVHRIRGEDDPAAAVEAYERELTVYFGRSLFTFDLAVLGMGSDGHTASIFRGDAAASATDQLVMTVTPEGLQHKRITLTVPVLNHTVTSLFLVTGPEKAASVRDVLEEGNAKGHPAGLVMPRRGHLLWFLDRPAAAMLTSED
jgi:6-phosphogluconolactonase